MSHRVVRASAICLGILAVTPMVAWIGTIVNRSSDLVDPDYLVAPLSLTASAETMIGLMSIIAVAVGAAVLMRAVRLGSLGRQWVAAVAPFAALAAFAGGVYAIATAPTIGANIGGGLVIMASPVVVGLLAWWAVHSIRMLRRPPTENQTG